MKRKLAYVQMLSRLSLGGKVAGVAVLETLRDWLPGTRLWVTGEPLHAGGEGADGDTGGRSVGSAEFMELAVYPAVVPPADFYDLLPGGGTGHDTGGGSAASDPCRLGAAVCESAGFAPARPESAELESARAEFARPESARLGPDRPESRGSGPTADPGPSGGVFPLGARPGIRLGLSGPRGCLCGARRELIAACLPYLARGLRESRPCRGPFAAESRSAMLVVDRAGRVQFQSPAAVELAELAGLLPCAPAPEGPTRLAAALSGWMLEGGAFSHDVRLTSPYGRFRLSLEALDGAGGRIFGVSLHYHEPLNLCLLRRLRRLAVPPKQQEVCLLLSFGYGTAGIAERLGLSPYTVAEHIQGLYRRLGVEGHTAALLNALYREPDFAWGRPAHRAPAAVLPLGTAGLASAAEAARALGPR